MIISDHDIVPNLVLIIYEILRNIEIFQSLVYLNQYSEGRGRIKKRKQIRKIAWFSAEVFNTTIS